MPMKIKARTVADYRAAHDKDVIIPNKIRAGLARLLAIGPEHYADNEEFRALCGVQAAELATYRNQFARNWFIVAGTNRSKTPKRIWFGNPKVADRLRPTPPEKESST